MSAYTVQSTSCEACGVLTLRAWLQGRKRSVMLNLAMITTLMALIWCRIKAFETLDYTMDTCTEGNECPITFKPFSDEGDQMPRILPKCGHTVSTQGLATLLEYSSEAEGTLKHSDSGENDMEMSLLSNRVIQVGSGDAPRLITCPTCYVQQKVRQPEFSQFISMACIYLLDLKGSLVRAFALSCFYTHSNRMRICSMRKYAAVRPTSLV